MTVFTYEKVKDLLEAASELLGNIYDAGQQAPDVICDEDDDYPRDEDGDPVFHDVFALQQAVDALRAEDTTVPAGWDKIEADDVPLDSPSRMIYHPDPE